MGGPQVPPAAPAERRAPLFSDMFSVLVGPRDKQNSPSPKETARSSMSLLTDPGNGGPAAQDLPAPILPPSFPKVLSLEVVRSLHLPNMRGGLTALEKKRDAASSTEMTTSAPVPTPNQGDKDAALSLVWNFMSIAPWQPAAPDGSLPPTVEPPVSPDMSGPTPAVRSTAYAALAAPLPTSGSHQIGPLPLQTISAIRPESRFAPEATLIATDQVPQNPEAALAVSPNAPTYADGKNPLPQPAPVMTPPAAFSAGTDLTAPVPPVPAQASPRERPDIPASNPAAGWEDSRQLNLAFAARLVPLPPPDIVPLSSPPGTDPSVPAAKQESVAPLSTVAAKAHAEISAHPVLKNVESERARKTADLAAAAVLKATNPELQPVEIPRDNSQPAQETAAPEPGQPPVRTENQPLPEPAPAAGQARNFQFRVSEGGKRVDVRLTERGGEVHVSVRTPDAKLAGALREDLPVLSAKLEQSGFRAETWRPGMSTPPPHFRADETGFSNTPHGQNPPPRQGSQEQQQAPPRRPKPSQAESATTSQRKEFSWHISQLR
jgi:hypothetical protein